MAGRGTRERRDGNFIKPEGNMLSKSHLPTVNVKTLIEKIEEVSPNHINQALHEAASTFKKVCVGVKMLKDVMLKLHCRALTNPKFGEKYIMVLGQLSNYAVDNVPVRSELLSFIENEFKVREAMFHSDTTRFVNAVTLLGNVYNLVKIHGVPLKVLAMPMLEYLNLLLEGTKEHHRVLAVQVLLNGEKIFRTEGLGSKLELLKQNMRKTLIARELGYNSKCWILLALDYMLNDMKPLSEELRNFYLEALGDDCVHVNYLLEHPVSKWENTSGKSETSESCTTDSEDVFKDIENVTIPPEVLNASSTECKAPRLQRFSNVGPKVNNNINEREGKNSKVTRGGESHRENGAGNRGGDDLYGLQIEREKISKTLFKRNLK